MEQILLSEEIPTSEPVNLAEYFTEFASMCPQSQPSQAYNRPTSVTQSMILEEICNLTKGQRQFCWDLSDLEASCSVDQLKPDGDLVPLPEKLHNRSKINVAYPLSEDIHVGLKFTRIQEQLKPIKEFIMGRDRHKKNTIKIKTVTNNDSLLLDLTPGKEFIVSIAVYQPFTTNHGAPRLLFSHEIEALGSTTLAEVANLIECKADKMVLKEVHHPDDLPQVRPSDYPSRFLFIGETFYNDLSSEKCMDLSEVIVKWAKEKGIGTFKTNDMHKVKFNELTIRFGYPYVYQHQGDCEHIIVFTDARLLQGLDCLYSKLYPRITAICRQSHTLCYLCDSFQANWLLKKCDFLPLETSYLCTKCCKSYCYIDQEKVGNFQLYPYFLENLCMRTFEV